MKKISTLSILLLATLFTTGAAFAWPGHQGGKRFADCDRRGAGMNYEQRAERMENRMERMAVILDLSEEQKTKLEDLREKHFQNRQTMREEMQQSREDLRNYKFSKEFNEKDFRALAKKNAELKTEMMVQGAKQRQEMLAVLTPEQQEKAEKLQMMGGFGPGHERFGKRGGVNCDGDGPCRQGGKGFGPGQARPCYNN